MLLPLQRSTTMSLFHLNLRTSADFILDEDGTELADLAAAEESATRSAREMMSADVCNGDLQLDESIEIHDAQGRYLSAIRFSDVLKIRLGTHEVVARG
jgi:hypothetical protein